MPGRQWIELGERAARGFRLAQIGGHAARRRAPLRVLGGLGIARRRRDHAGWLALRRIGFAEDVAFERRDAVIVGGAAPQHRARRHQRAFGRLDDLHVAGAAALARNAIVGRVDEAHIFGRLLVEQRVAALGIGRARPMPRLRIARQHMRPVACSDIGRRVVRQAGVAADLRVAAMAVGAAQNDRGRAVHRLLVARRVAGDAARALRVGFRVALALRRGWREHIGDITRLLALGREQLRRAGQSHDRGKRQQAALEPAEGGGG